MMAKRFFLAILFLLGFSVSEVHWGGTAKGESGLFGERVLFQYGDLEINNASIGCDLVGLLKGGLHPFDFVEKSSAVLFKNDTVMGFRKHDKIILMKVVSKDVVFRVVLHKENLRELFGEE
jgi:hypothetical protein